MEKVADLPLKYLFPSFEATHWFAARQLIDELRDFNRLGIVPPHLLRGLKALVTSLKLWASDDEVINFFLRIYVFICSLSCYKIFSIKY